MILENARKKEREAAQAEWEQQYGWAKQISPQQVQDWAAVAQEMASDPLAFLQRFSAELQSHPQYAPQLRSYLAKTLASRPAAAQTEPEPDIDILDANGNPTGQRTYSGTQLTKWREWNNGQLLERWQQQIAPTQQYVQQLQQQEQEAKTQAVVAQYAKQQTDFVKGLPGYTEHRDAIRAAMEQMPPVSSHHELGAQLLQAYIKTVLPKISQSERAAVLADINKQAQATNPNPNSPTAAAPSGRGAGGFGAELRRQLAGGA